MDTHSFILHMKTNDISTDIAEDVETTFDTSSYELDRALPKGYNKKVFGLIRQKNYDNICWIKSKHLQLLNR